jgi:hypothetical protein
MLTNVSESRTSDNGTGTMHWKCNDRQAVRTGAHATISARCHKVNRCRAIPYRVTRWRCRTLAYRFSYNDRCGDAECDRLVGLLA